MAKERKFPRLCELFINFYLSSLYFIDKHTYKNSNFCIRSKLLPDHTLKESKNLS